MKRSTAGRALLIALAIGGAASAARAASPEWEAPAISHKDVRPYFDDVAIKGLVLPPPPAEGSLADADDVAAVMRGQQVDAARRAVAEEDGAWLYDRFAEAFGRPIRRDSAPALVALLNRVERQVSGPVFAAKKDHGRTRPYQRLQLSHVCGEVKAPAPDPDAKKRTSYPSGHSAYGWAAALILARLAPERAPAILQRAMDYGESRVICGMHFPSDVAAARVVATAVVARLDRSPEFLADLEQVRQELARAEQGR
ncbi:membrane-associated phospholipid phosphatase [Sphingomonas sp. MM-1]|uniref:phosphatase PAP2 family protein n=1 Tax=Sphingomonas sp. MM-1 TaxID=745310 RepID=UPI0002C0E53F|nr:phosphatase PAP2 family protein [Sphingomonas sp. MM-1]AGH50033.1 membrane-associated phospholipid phosphatase [Sphingomonas sp. MM-1]